MDRFCPKEIVMTKHLASLAAGMIALLVASSAALGVGTASRTFVSGVGTDTGTCPLATPCRTFAYALTQTAPSGEIIVLSSAGYGTVTITQSVSIINTSSFAGVTVNSGNGITINAGATDSVTLRGLTIDGGGTGSNGIVFTAGGKLTIDQCNLMNFVGNTSTGNGILIQPTTGNHNIAITNTTASNNQYSGVFHFPLSGSTATTGIVIDRVSANNNGNGIGIANANSSGAAFAGISNSMASFNGTNGFYFSNVTASLDASNATSNNVGVQMVSGTLALGRSVIMNNVVFGLNTDGPGPVIGTVNSYEDNRIAGNGINVSLIVPAVAQLH
jgi:hypothetical protein